MAQQRLRSLRDLLGAGTDQPRTLDYALAGAALGLWILTDCFEVRLAFSRDHLQVALANLSWRPQCLLGPWLLAAGGLVSALARQRWTQAGRSMALGQRLRQVWQLMLVLLAGRLLCCWDSALSLFPYLGMLWAPHATWALGISCLVLLLSGPDSTKAQAGRRLVGERAIAGVVFVLALLLYGAGALYLCQVTMLHGDEGHYLLVTHSLLHDGDMDLANEVNQESLHEFHLLPIEPHKAPASPPGRIYSVHPIGLSIGLLPGYWAGLKLWSNPRLGAALCMVVLAAGCLALAFLWLRRLGFGRAIALTGVAAVALTPPFALYSSQLYPEVPALLIALIVLVSLPHWQVQDAGYQPLGGRAEPLWLGLLGLLVACLPFLHPRYAPLAAGCWALLLLQAWRSSQRRRCLIVVGAAAVANFGALVAFNNGFSGDWMGAFRPGNAWGEDALRLAALAESLPGQWLHSAKGLLHSAPVYLWAILGLLLGIAQRDRRAYLAIGLYLLTAIPNGLHPLWTFGYGFPARFLITALPVLLLGLVLAAPVLARRPIALFLVALTFVISIETTTTSLALPEDAYEGDNLDRRQIAEYYPFGMHLVGESVKGLTWGTVTFWGLVLAGAFITLSGLPPIQRRWRGAVILAVALLPAAYGRTAEVAALLPHVLPERVPYLVRGKAGPQEMAAVIRMPPTVVAPGVRKIADQLEVQELTDPAGGIARYGFPVVMPGTLMQVAAPYMAQTPDQAPAGTLVLAKRYTVAAVGPWEERLSLPLRPGQHQAIFTVPQQDRTISYLSSEFAGHGTVRLGTPQVMYMAGPVQPTARELTRLDLGEGVVLEPGSLRGSHQLALAPGVYRACIEVTGSTAKTLFSRSSPPIALAVFQAPLDSTEARARLRSQAEEWAAKGSPVSGSARPGFTRPLGESVQPVWWLAVPWVGSRHYQLEFPISEASEAIVIARYAGKLELRLRALVIEQLLGSPLAAETGMVF